MKVFSVEVLFFIFLFCSTSNLAFPRAGLSRYIDNDNGLLSNSVNCFDQDSDGFMWVGTNRGLQRYDGYRFETFTPPHLKDALSLVNVMASDSTGNLYIGTHTGGLLKLSADRKKFEVYKQNINDSLSLSNNLVSDILISGESVWLATFDGVDLYHPGNNIFEHFKPFGNVDDSEQRNWVVSIHPLDALHLLVLTRDGRVLKFGKKEKRFEGVADFSETEFRASFLEGTKLWIGTSDRLLFFDLKTGEKRSYFPHHPDLKRPHGNPVSGLEMDAMGRLWIATYRGVNYLDTNSGEFSYILPDPEGRNTVADVSISCIYRDRDDGIWLGTSRGGINYLPNIHNRFHLIQKDRERPVLPSNEVNNILAVNNGKVWVQTIGRFAFISENKETGFFEAGRADIPDSLTIYSRLLFASDSVVWIQSKTGEVYCWETTGSPPEHVSLPLIDRARVESMVKGSRNDYYLLVEGRGVVVLEGNTRKPGWLVKQGEHCSSFHDKKSDLLFSNDKLFFTTSGVLNIFNISDSSKYCLRDTTDKALSFGQAVMDGIGNIWIATNNGITRFDEEKKNFRDFPFPKYAGTVTVYCLEIDDSGNTWIGTNKGLARFDRESGEFHFFSSKEGIPGRLLLTSGKAADGRMFFGGLNGLVWFYPDRIKIREINQRPVVSKISAGSDTLVYSHQHGKRFIVPPGQNSLTVHFSLPRYPFLDDVKYMHRLNGLDDDWQVTSTPSVSYSDLAPGEYQLLVKSIDYSWKEGPDLLIPVSISRKEDISGVVEPRFWILGLLGFGLGLIVFIVVRRRLFRTIVPKPLLPEVIPGEGGELEAVAMASRIVKSNLTNPDFNVAFFAREMGLSQTSLYNMMKEEIGKTPHEFITVIRMEYAATLIQKGNYRVTDVADLAGYSDIAVFSRNFKKFFGVSPSKYDASSKTID